MKHMLKELKKNNKGVSLIELMVGIAMLAIIIIPVFNTFITSARINKEARKVMIATDVAQTIMEGITEKSFTEMTDSFTALSTHPPGAPSDNVVSSNLALSTINNNVYNMTANFREINTFDVLSSVSLNQLTFNGITYNNSDLVSANGVSINSAFGNSYVVPIINGAGSDSKFLCGYINNDGNMDNLMMLAYTNVEHGGYHFDVVVSFIPMAEDPADLYYPYYVNIQLFDYEPNVSDNSVRMLEPILSIESGIGK